MTTAAWAVLVVGAGLLGVAVGMLVGAGWIIARYEMWSRVAYDLAREIDACITDIDASLRRMGLRR